MNFLELPFFLIISQPGGKPFIDSVVKTSAKLLAVALYLSLIAAAFIPAVDQYHTAILYGPTSLFDQPLKTREAVVRQLVPKGSVILFLFTKEIPWELGLWERILYPDYEVTPVQTSPANARANARRYRSARSAGYALCADSLCSEIGLDWSKPLPPDPSIPGLVLGQLAHD